MAGVTCIPIVALDFPRATEALEMVETLGDSCRFYKVGSELFTAEGPVIVARLREHECDVFLDLKLHDIPNTVASAVRVISAMGVRLTTVHATGGRAMIRAAAEAARQSGDCRVLAVTILTSLTGEDVAESWGANTVDVSKQVLRLASVARQDGAHGVVCSGSEAAAVRAEQGPAFHILVPGVRMAGDSAADQARVVTPEEAAGAGADYIVLGRSVTRSRDPREVMEHVRRQVVNSTAAST